MLEQMDENEQPGSEKKQSQQVPLQRSTQKIQKNYQTMTLVDKISTTPFNITEGNDDFASATAGDSGIIAAAIAASLSGSGLNLNSQFNTTPNFSPIKKKNKSNRSNNGAAALSSSGNKVSFQNGYNKNISKSFNFQKTLSSEAQIQMAARSLQVCCKSNDKSKLYQLYPYEIQAILSNQEELNIQKIDEITKQLESPQPFEVPQALDSMKIVMEQQESIVRNLNSKFLEVFAQFEEKKQNLSTLSSMNNTENGQSSQYSNSNSIYNSHSNHINSHLHHHNLNSSKTTPTNFSTMPQNEYKDDFKEQLMDYQEDLDSISDMLSPPQMNHQFENGLVVADSKSHFQLNDSIHASTNMSGSVSGGINSGSSIGPSGVILENGGVKQLDKLRNGNIRNGNIDQGISSHHSNITCGNHSSDAVMVPLTQMENLISKRDDINNYYKIHQQLENSGNENQMPTALYARSNHNFQHQHVLQENNNNHHHLIIDEQPFPLYQQYQMPLDDDFMELRGMKQIDEDIDFIRKRHFMVHDYTDMIETDINNNQVYDDLLNSNSQIKIQRNDQMFYESKQIGFEEYLDL